MKTTFDTTEYEASHGVRPRGNGCWAFSISGTDGHGRWTTLHDTLFVPGPQTLTAAKREAKRIGEADARNVGAVRELLIEVLP